MLPAINIAWLTERQSRNALSQVTLCRRIIQFDYPKHRALRVLDYGKASYAGNVHCRHNRLRSEFVSFLKLGICILDGKVHEPVRWNLSHLRRWRIHSSGGPIAVHERRVSHWPHLLNVFAPTEKARIEITGLRCVGSCQFIPAERIGHVYNS